MSASEESKPSINPLRRRLEADEPALGILVTMPSPHMVQIFAGNGFDWVFIDMEHGPIGIESAYAMINATAGTATAPIVRVPWNVHWLVKPVLDAGAMGVIFPMICTAAEAEQAVRAVHYPPTGVRGHGPFYAPLRWGLDGAEYPAAAERELLTIVLIEHIDAVRNLKEILAVPGVDAALVAPFDLSMSIAPGEGPEHPEVRAAIAEAEGIILESPVHLGGLAGDAEHGRALIERGNRLVLLGYDALLIDRAAGEMLTRVRA